MLAVNTMRTVIKRDISADITQYLATDNIIVLHGARQVGKTHILYYLQDRLKAQRELYYFFDLEDSRLVDILNDGVPAFLTYLHNEGANLEKIKKTNKKFYVFIDEIQYLQNPSPFLKLLADHHKYIQLIVSGSSSFDMKSKFSDSLTGRTVNFEIFNLSFREFLRFKNIHYDFSDALSAVHLYKLQILYMEYIFFGGYPKIVLENTIVKKEKYLQQIVDTYVKKDVRDLANVKDTQKFNNLLKLLAAQSGQLINITQLSKACMLAKQTIEHYLFILENTYIIKLLKPFSSNAKIEVTKSPKVFFYDTGLLQMLWLRNLQKNILGNMFETSIFAELVKKYGTANLYYWRTKNQQEIDFILNIKNKLMPIEAKENFDKFNKSAIQVFCKKYNAKEYMVVIWKGPKKDKNYIYPWEI